MDPLEVSHYAYFVMDFPGPEEPGINRLWGVPRNLSGKAPGVGRESFSACGRVAHFVGATAVPAVGAQSSPSQTEYKGGSRCLLTGKLSEEEISELTAWVNQGAPWCEGKVIEAGSASAVEPVYLSAFRSRPEARVRLRLLRSGRLPRRREPGDDLRLPRHPPASAGPRPQAAHLLPQRHPAPPDRRARPRCRSAAGVVRRPRF